jgi:hypothetical protein
VITSTSPLPGGTTNTVYNSAGAVAFTGGVAPVTLGITAGALPHGLSLNTSTGLITGTPDTTAGNFGAFNFTVTATDTAIPPQVVGKAFMITITPPLLAITNTTLPNGQVGFNYTGAVQGMGGFPPLAYSVSAGTFPNGLVLNAATGAITSMPTVANTFNFTIQVMDAAAQTATQAYIVIIAPPISVALSTPPPGTLQASLTAVVQATVSNDLPAGGGVDWSVTCGSANACGTFNPIHTASGVNTTYTAPAAVPTGGTVTIIATSHADATKTASSSPVTITPPPIVVNITTQPASSVQVNTTSLVTATVTNDPMTKGVDWTLACGGGTCGTITLHTASGSPATFTAPAAVPPATVTITATSTADNTKSANANAVTITLAPPISVNISMQPPSSVQINTTSMVTATVTNDPMNKGVDWTLACGGGTCGTITLHTASGSAATFTAPAAVPPAAVTITATSTADNTKSANANPVTITVPVIVIVFTSAPPATLAVNGTAMVSSTVTNDPMTKGVDWTVTCGSALCGSFNPTHTASAANTTFTAPAAVPTGTTVTIKAASTADNTKFVTMVVTITSVATSNSKLNGHYAFRFQGWEDPGETPMAMAGSFVADGSGGITGADADINRASGVTRLASSTGTYSVNATDNRGTLTVGGIKFKFALESFNAGVASKGAMIEFDDLTGTSGTRGSGQFKMQDITAFTAASFTNDYAFGLSGDLSGTRLSVAGRLTADGVSTLSAGHLDVSGEGTASGDLTFNGSFTAPSAATGRGTLQLTNLTVLSPALGGITPNFTYYVVNAGQNFMVSTDPRGVSAPLLSGGTKQQTGGPFTAANSLTGPIIFNVAGHDSSQVLASNTAIGRVIPTGSGNISGLIDQHADGAVNASVPFTGTITLDASGNGRGVITFVIAAAGTKPQVIYMVQANQGFVLEGTSTTPGNDATLGTFDAQTAPLTLSGTYSLGSGEPATRDTPNLSGVFTTSSATAASGTVDTINGSGTTLKADLAVTFTVTAPDVNGRGTMTVTTTSTGSMTTLIYWVQSSTSFVVMDSNVADTNNQIIYAQP